MKNNSRMTTSSLTASFAQRHRAFSLVELLIVIAIVSVLSAILLSAFSAVRNGAQRSACISNLQQLGKVLELYAQDHRGFYPPGKRYASPHGTFCGWGERIYPYVRSTAIFKCPSHPYGEFRTGCLPPDTTTADTPIFYDGSYAMNLMGRLLATTAINQVRLRNPSNTVLVMGNDHTGQFSELDPASSSYEGVYGLIRSGVYARHGAGDNLLFADGHVRWMSLESMAQKGKDFWRPSGAS